MLQIIIQLIESLTPYGSLSYAIMFAILIACGFGFPMPEDVVLITGGILASREVVTFTNTFIVTMAGVLIGDGIVFTIGRVYGQKVKQLGPFKKIFTPKRDEKIMNWFAKYGDKVIFFARFAPGLRTPLFLTAGSYRVSYTKFLVLDGFAAIISVPVWIWVGYIFGANLELLEQKVRQLQMGMYSLLGIALTALIAGIYIKKKIHTKMEL